MRITREMFQRSLIRNIHNAEAKQQELFNQIASGKKINTPSDDPMGVKKVVSLKDELSQVERFKQNNAEAMEFINFGEGSLSSVLSKLETAMATAQQARNATVDADMREMFAGQIKEVIESMVSDANTKHGDKYLFGGTVTKHAPFNLKYENEESLTIADYGDPIWLANVQLSNAAVIVKAGSKTFDETNFSLDRRNGTITILAGSQMETDGITDFDISYETKDPVLVLPETGETKGSNNREVMKGDVLQVNISGEEIFVEEENIFEALYTLKNALVRNDTEKLGQSIFSVEGAITKVAKYAGVFALKYEHVQNVSESLDRYELQMQSLQSHVEDTDIAEASVRLELANNSYQVILRSASKMLNISLMDYLQ